MRLRAVFVDAWRAVGTLMLGAIFVPASGSLLHAQPKSETRNFSVTIDDKPAGTYVMNIRLDPDGTQRMTGKADVKLRTYLVYNYSYKYSGTEIWWNDRLVRLTSETDD